MGVCCRGHRSERRVEQPDSVERIYRPPVELESPTRMRHGKSILRLCISFCAPGLAFRPGRTQWSGATSEKPSPPCQVSRRTCPDLQGSLVRATQSTDDRGMRREVQTFVAGGPLPDWDAREEEIDRRVLS
ncbi:hypothetical protein KPP03845_200209 (plasmid) [Streptomyces xanthophaeus]|nr:hypothetical protein KPP03845_200209 [Streptomyces xanthophaeus]